MFVVQFRPEQRQQRVAAVETMRGGDGEVGQEGGPLRRREDRPKLATLGVVEVETAERAEFNHKNDTPSVKPLAADVTLV